MPRAMRWFAFQSMPPSSTASSRPPAACNVASARSTANSMLNAALYGEHPLVLPAEGNPASLAGLEFNQVRTVYRKAFSPDNLIFSIVGPATHETLKSTLEDQLSGKGTPTAGFSDGSKP